MNNYNPDQLKAVTHINGPALVLAGPGSGKTFVITGRIRYLISNNNVNPDKILVITFTKEAAVEMKTRFIRACNGQYENMGVHFGTFHSLFYHILKQQRLYNENSVLTVKEKIKIIISIGTKLGIKEAVFEEWQKEMLSKISIYKTGRDPFDEDADDKLRKVFQNVYDEYTAFCRRIHRLDFDDMIIECKKLFENIPRVLNKWQEKYEYIMVDEFQDIDNMQYELLKMLAGDNDNIFCVGDDDQSIYSFRGADPAIMQRYETEYTDKGLKIINLKVNYRSSGTIIRTSSQLISHNRFRFKKEQIGLKDSIVGQVEAKVFKNSLDEADYVCDKITELLTLDGKLNIAVLYRSERNSEVLRGCLEKKKLTGNGEKKILLELRKDILSYFSIIFGWPNINDFLRILNRPIRGIMRESLSDSFQYLNSVEREDVHRILEDIVSFNNSDMASKTMQSDIIFMEGMPMFAAFNYLQNKVGYRDYIINKYKEESERKLIIDEIESIGQLIKKVSSYRTFERELKLAVSFDEGTSGDYDKIIMQTVHASKGLEYDAVFVIGLQEGVFPGKKSVNTAQIEEERRIMYVAMTRAKAYLYLCGIHKDDYGKQESRFIHESNIRITYKNADNA